MIKVGRGLATRNGGLIYLHMTSINIRCIKTGNFVVEENYAVFLVGLPKRMDSAALESLTISRGVSILEPKCVLFWTCDQI